MKGVKSGEEHGCVRGDREGRCGRRALICEDRDVEQGARRFGGGRVDWQRCRGVDGEGVCGGSGVGRLKATLVPEEAGARG